MSLQFENLKGSHLTVKGGSAQHCWLHSFLEVKLKVCTWVIFWCTEAKWQKLCSGTWCVASPVTQPVCSAWSIFVHVSSCRRPSSGLCGPTTSSATRRTTRSRLFSTFTSGTRRWVRRAAWQWWAPAGTCLRPAPASWSSTCRSARPWVRRRPARSTQP